MHSTLRDKIYMPGRHQKIGQSPSNRVQLKSYVIIFKILENSLNLKKNNL
jgi:hypothetical protein